MLKPPRHLCYFIDTHVIGGAERYLLDLVNSMGGRGYRITIICHHFPDLLAFIQKTRTVPCDIISCVLPSITRSRVVQAGLAINRSWLGVFNLLKIPGLLYYYWNTLRCMVRLWPVLKRVSPDIVHISSGGYPAGESNRAVVFVARALKIPRRILTVHSQAIGAPILYPERWIDRAVQSSLNAIITASEDSRLSLIEKRGFRPESVGVIYCGVEPIPADSRPDPRELRRALGLLGDGKWIGAIGALQPGKGFAILIDAVSQLRGRQMDCRLAIIGTGPEEESLQNQIDRLHLRDQVYLLGYLDQAHRYLRAFDILAFSSNRYECVPYAIKDAMMADIPVVSTKIGGTTEAIRHRETGLLVPPDDPTAMADALDHLLRDPGVCAELTDKAKRLAESCFALVDMLNRTEALYRNSREEA